MGRNRDGGRGLLARVGRIQSGLFRAKGTVYSPSEGSTVLSTTVCSRAVMVERQRDGGETKPFQLDVISLTLATWRLSATLTPCPRPFSSSPSSPGFSLPESCSLCSCDHTNYTTASTSRSDSQLSRMMSWTHSRNSSLLLVCILQVLLPQT